MFRTSNPTLNNEAFSATGGMSLASPNEKVMTLSSTVAKSGLLVGTCTAAAAGTWMLVSDNPSLAFPLAIGGSLLAMVMVFVSCFTPKAATFTAMPVAVCEGVFAGGFSFVLTQIAFRNRPEGASTPIGDNPENAVFAALLLTLCIAGGLLMGYATKLIRPNALFRNVVIAGTLGLCLFGLIAMVSMLFGNNTLVSVYDPANGGLISIGFSVVVTVLAAANLVLDYETIHNGVRNRAPKYFEWYGAQSLLITLVWLYIEVLRLVLKLANRE